MNKLSKTPKELFTIGQFCVQCNKHHQLEVDVPGWDMVWKRLGQPCLSCGIVDVSLQCVECFSTETIALNFLELQRKLPLRCTHCGKVALRLRQGIVYPNPIVAPDKAPIERQYGILHPPRVGSYFAADLLRAVNIKQGHDVAILGEFGSSDCLPLDLGNSFIVKITFDTAEYPLQIFKGIPLNLLNYLANNGRLVILERRNRFDQFISWMIASMSDQWQSHQNVEPFSVSKVWWDKRRHDYCVFRRLCRRYEDRIPLIYYEDIRQNPRVLFEAFGMSVNTIPEPEIVRKKYNTVTEKRQMILNIEECEHWFQNDTLLCEQTRKNLLVEC